MLIIDTLLVSGIKFVLTRLAEAVSAEMYDETALREELLAAQMKLELGEIDEADFARIEERILAGMREVRARRGEAAPKPGSTFAVESIEADLRHDEDVHD
jgi:hypothetical protein